MIDQAFMTFSFEATQITIHDEISLMFLFDYLKLRSITDSFFYFLVSASKISNGLSEIQR